MIIKRQKTFARADYEGLDGIARKQLAEKRSQIAKDLLKKRAENYQAVASDLAKPNTIGSGVNLAKGRLNFRNTVAIGSANVAAADAHWQAKRDMLNRQQARRVAALQKRAHARATKRKIIGGVALGAIGGALGVGANYLYNKKKKSQENQEAASNSES